MRRREPTRDLESSETYLPTQGREDTGSSPSFPSPGTSPSRTSAPRGYVRGLEPGAVFGNARFVRESRFLRESTDFDAAATARLAERCIEALRDAPAAQLEAAR